MFVKKSPYKTATSEILFETSFSLAIHFKSLKSALKISPTSGDIIPPVNDVTTCLKAAPITKPTAISTKLPFTANFLNSFSIPILNIILEELQFKKMLGL